MVLITILQADQSTPLLKFYNTGATGMNASNGDIYADTYTLEAASGYLITGYTLNGTATGGDVTITPSGESATVISSDNSLADALAVTVGSRSTTFQLSGEGHIGGISLIVSVTEILSSTAYVSVGEKTASFTADDSHWYILTQVRNGETPMYNVGTGSLLKRTATSITTSTINGTKVINNLQYLIRFTETADNSGLYNIQFADGDYITSDLKTTSNAANAGNYAFYNTNNGEGSYFAWNLNSNTGNKVDNNGAGNTLAFWGSGTVSGTSGNNVWYLYPVEIEEPSTTVTYVVSDATGIVFTSDPVPATEGATISELPSEYQRAYCTYTLTPTTLSAGENTINVTVQYNLPFTTSTSFNDATWYYAKIRGTKYLRADADQKDTSNRYLTSSANGRTDEYKWAFFGTPYTNVYIANKAFGDGYYLSYVSGNDKGPEMVEVASPTTENKALWEITSNSNGGFTVRSITGSTLYTNDAGNTGCLGYWNNASGANDPGSNWSIEEVSVSDKNALQAAIANASNWVNNAGIPGYPTTSAATTLSTAISAAQSVYDDAAGDYLNAYNTLTAAITTATATENINYTPRTDVYYTIVNARGAMVYDSSHSSSVDATNNNAEYVWYGSATPDATNVNNLWGFIEQDGHYYMYNVGKQQFAAIGKGSYAGETWIFSDTPAYITLDDGIANEIAAPKVRVRATVATTGNSYTMSVSTSYTGPIITYDANGDGGVPMLFTESSVAVDPDITATMTAKVEDLTPYFTALKNAIDKYSVVTFGAGLNQYATNSAFTTALDAANTTHGNESSTKEELQTALNNLESAAATLRLNMPQANTFLRFKANSTGKYIGYAESGKQPLVDEASAGIYLYTSSQNLVSYSQGRYLSASTGNAVTEVGTVGGVFGFYETAYSTPTLGTYRIRVTNNAYGSIIAWTDGYLNGWGEGDNALCEWVIEEVTSLPVTISAAGYATLFAPVALTIPAGVQAYYVSALTEKEATLTEITTTIPANTPVILYAADQAEATTYDFDITTAGDFSGTNKLEGQVAAQSVEDGAAYTLQQNVAKTAVGLFPKTAGTIAGFKAYLPATAFDAAGSAGVKGFTFNFDDLTTAVSAIERANRQGAIYDLSGRRVSKAQKGIYIVGGKKVTIK